MESDEIGYKKLTIAVIIIGVILRFSLAPIYSVSGDACWQLSASKFIAENKRLPLYENLGRDEPFWTPPLFHILSALMYIGAVPFGNAASNFAIKLLSPILGSLTLLLAFLICKKLLDDKTAFYSMIFVTFLPIFVDYHVFGYIDGTVTFFVVASIYFALCKRCFISSVFAGLAGLSKYNGLFVVPLLLFMAFENSKNKRLLCKRVALIITIPLIISAPYIARNYANFKNPIWPFANFLFNGKDTSSFESIDVKSFKLGNIFSVNSVVFNYLAIFGVPDGNPGNIFFFNIAFIKLLAALWLFGTLLFVLPFLKSLKASYDKEKQNRRFFLVWIFSYAAVLVLYIGNAGFSSARFFLPAIPALGMLYGVGCKNMIETKKAAKFRISPLFFNIILFSIIIGLVAAECTKIYLASREWNRYGDDFDWIRKNTKKDDLIIPGAQCLYYHTQRGTLKGIAENLKNANYVFVNKNFNLERRSIASKEILEQIKKNNYRKVYENKETGTRIYRIN